MSTTNTATATKSTKANGKKTAPQSPLVLALLSAIESLGNIPPAPVFNDADLRKAMSAMGLPEKAIANAVDYARKQHEETHGDTTENQLSIVFRALIECEGMDNETVAKVCKLVTSGPRKERKELTDAEKTELKALYTAGGPNGQRSVLAQKFGVSDATVYNLTKDLTRAAS